MSYSSYGPGPDDPIDTLDDILQTVNSLSKISRNEQSPKIKKSNAYQGPSGLYNSSVDNSSTFNDYHPYQSCSSSGPLNIGRGRGRYMETLAQKFGNEDKIVLRDKMIHEQLQQINGSGYSNFDIEQRFGYSPTDYSFNNWSIVTEKSTSSSLISTEEKSTSETESEKTHSDESSPLEKSTSSSRLTNDEANLLLAGSEIEEQQYLGDPFSAEKPPCPLINNAEGTSSELEKEHLGDPFSPEKPFCSLINNEEGTSTELEKGHLENGEFEERNLFELKKDKYEEIVVKKTPKKKKERKCRNIVVLSLMQKLDTPLFAPAVQSPPEHAERKPWILDSKESIFCPEDFPSL